MLVTAERGNLCTTDWINPRAKSMNVADWETTYGLSGIHGVLVEFGVSDLDDIQVLCNEKDLAEIRCRVPKVQFRRLLYAVREEFHGIHNLECLISNLGGAPERKAISNPGSSSLSTDLSDWLASHGAESMKDALENIGVAKVEDIAYVFNDEDLSEVKNQVARVQYRKFEAGASKIYPKFGSPKQPNVRARHEKDAKVRDISGATRHNRSSSKQKMQSRGERLKAIRKMDVLIKQSREIDLCFVIDLTFSMDEHWKRLQTGINELVENLQFVLSELPLRVAFVGYREHVRAKKHSKIAVAGKCNCPNRLAVQNFTPDICSFEEATKRHSVSLGHGNCADVHGGLNAAVSELDWNSTTRILYHIGDEPCHGSSFHDYRAEEYPNGDPTGLNMADILRSMAEKRIMYFFGKIYDRTDKMISMFRKMRISDLPIEQVDQVDASSLIQVASEIVSRTVSRTVSATSNSSGLSVKPRELITTAFVPNWCSVEATECKVWTAITPDSIVGVLSASEDPENILYRSLKKELKVGKHPFSKGGVRFAYYACVNNQLCVAKSFVSENSDHHSRSRYAQSLICHVGASYFATAFNRAVQELEMNCSRIEVLLPRLFEIDRETFPFYLLEPYLEGEYVKFNNNNGYVLRQPGYVQSHDIVQTFSHWTYHHSNGYICVVDCQGVRDASRNVYRLTDPALHCRDILKFDTTNRGVKGMKEFFSTHKCNYICSLLQLDKTFC